jgi:lipid-A-disaccharide synthase
VSETPPLRVAIVAGEESGDLLGANLIRSLASATGRDVQLIGVGGEHLRSMGLKSLFDPVEIALIGVSAVIRDLPRLLGRIRSTAATIAQAKPDCLITVDSPDFTLRVARRVRKRNPAIPIVHYVCPSVWAWRPGRAPAMKPHVDHVLCLLPFEPAALERLGGPPGTFVGHRLTHEPGLVAAAEKQRNRRPSDVETRTLLLLPGSRRSEVRRLVGLFGEIVAVLRERGNRLKLVLPTVPAVRSLVEDATSSWPDRPEIIVDADGKWRAFGVADAALCASGTVTLELALAGVPLASCYRFDWIERRFTFLIKSWSASLPNLIADRPIVPEFYDHLLRPPYIARHLEALLDDTAMRQWQRDGYDEVTRRLARERPPGDVAAEVVLQVVKESSRRSTGRIDAKPTKV